MDDAMKRFIESNRLELVTCILKAVPNMEAPDDEGIEDWINNDESLYDWAMIDGAIEENGH